MFCVLVEIFVLQKPSIKHSNVFDTCTWKLLSMVVLKKFRYFFFCD